jgi:threonine synthase
VNARAIPWTPGLGLRCSACDWTGPPELRFDGCERCRAPLETTYADGAHTPIPLDARTDLGLRTTPLVLCRSAAATFLKLESGNPTGSHKDRFHALTSALARLGGARGIVTASTGNHGVSCAAHAARDGLPCVVFATGALPHALSVQISAYGADVVHVGEDERRARLRELTAADWMPATASDPVLSGAGNPYGLDGYAAIADEIVHQLGLLPAIVCVPVASGDLLAGIARGFRRHASPGRRALVVACQPAAASPLAASLAAGDPVTLGKHASLARSTSDASSGRLAFAAVQDDCALVTVTEHSIAEATRRLAREGFYVETSSALALAGVDEARARGLAERDDTAVAIITASGRGWSEEVPDLFSPLPSARVASVTGSRSRRA